MAYTDLDDLIADYIPAAKNKSEKDALERILAGVSAFVDKYCDRKPGYFEAASDTASARNCRGEGEHFLRVPRHVPGSITSVTVIGYTVPDTAYYESDKNGWIYFDNSNINLFANGDDAAFQFQNTFLIANRYQWIDGVVYKVTAKWGYEATPTDLQEAIRQTVATIWERQHGVLGQVTPAGFVIERAMPLFAREVLDNYKRREFEI